MPLISIIVPIYNAEKFLSTCIDSILNQSFTAFELLLINDGSTDRSGILCENYALKDERIQVIHKENGGVSSARNVGISKALGDWITFVDSDDYISEDYFQPIEQYTNSDFILLSAKQFYDNQYEYLLNFNEECLSLDQFLRKYKLNPHFSACWGKFFKRKIIVDNKLTFNVQMNRGEDSLFNLEYIFYCSRIALTNSSLYFYRLESRGLSNKLLDINQEEYYFKSIMNILINQEIDDSLLIGSLKVPLTRYFFKILNSNLSITDKLQRLNWLIDEYDSKLKISLKNQRIHLIPYNYFIDLKMIKLLVIIANRKK